MSNPTQPVQKQTARRDIRALLESDNVRNQIALALPKHLTPERMMRVALTTINRTPKLLACTPESLLSGLMLCSQVGLEPDGRNAHLIPYGDQCQVIFDWKGLVALARRNGVQNIAADVVCENDVFEWYRDSEGLKFSHRVDWRKPRGQVFAAYCIWRNSNLSGFTQEFDGEVMTQEEIEGIRKRSRSGSNGPWVTDWREMAKKTVVRRASKKWPLDPEAATAFNSDDDSILPAEPKTTRPIFETQAPAIALPEPVAPVVELAGHGDDHPPGLEPKSPPATPPAEIPAPQAPLVNSTTSPGPAASTEKPELKKNGGRDFVKVVLQLCKMSKHTEAELLDWLRATGKCDDSMGSLIEISMVKPSCLEWVHDNWAATDKELKRVKDSDPNMAKG